MTLPEGKERIAAALVLQQTCIQAGLNACAGTPSLGGTGHVATSTLECPNNFDS